MLEITEVQVQPICWIFYNEIGTDFFDNLEKYKGDHEKLQVYIDIRNLQTISDAIVKELEQDRCRKYYITDNIYVAIIKTSSRNFSF